MPSRLTYILSLAVVLGATSAVLLDSQATHAAPKDDATVATYSHGHVKFLNLTRHPLHKIHSAMDAQH